MVRANSDNRTQPSLLSLLRQADDESLGAALVRLAAMAAAAHADAAQEADEDMEADEAGQVVHTEVDR